MNIDLLIAPVCFLIGVFAGAWITHRARHDLAPLEMPALPRISVFARKAAKPEPKVFQPKISS